eukprot:symbB.v1.2.019691.t1/scaffold1620.1/size227398/3
MHVVIVYLIKSVVLIRYIHGRCSPSQVEKRSCRSYMQHGGLGLVLLSFSFLVSQYGPFLFSVVGHHWRGLSR